MAIERITPVPGRRGSSDLHITFRELLAQMQRKLFSPAGAARELRSANADDVTPQRAVAGVLNTHPLTLKERGHIKLRG